MPLKRSTHAKAKKAPIRKLALKAKATAPAAIKGLAGFKKPLALVSASGNTIVDKGVAQQNAALASRAEVVPGLDARLVHVDLCSNSDKYYILQGLEDTKIPTSKPKRCYVYQRWGRTGTGGVCRLQGPMPLEEIERHFCKVFKTKTGVAWGSLSPGKIGPPGKYWLVSPPEVDHDAKWQYEVGAPSDSKSRETKDSVWGHYDPEASRQMEELYTEHRSTKRHHRSLASRLVSTGTFSYSIDFQTMTQTNMSTQHCRKIRRTTEATTLSSTKAESSIAISDSVAVLPSISEISSPKDMACVVRNGSVAKLNVPTLRNWLRHNGFTATGQKQDLVDRVHALIW
jgi:hypothetical protein